MEHEGSFKEGNQFWQARAKHGRDMLFSSPTVLWEGACEYFKWCDENPLYEHKAFAYQGEVVVEKLPKLRAYTMVGLCLFLDCSQSYFRTFKMTTGEGKNDFLTIIEKIEQTIYSQKFNAAAADLLNANIIARDLGLVDKKNVESDITASIKVNLSKEEAKDIAKILKDDY